MCAFHFLPALARGQEPDRAGESQLPDRQGSARGHMLVIHLEHAPIALWMLGLSEPSSANLLC